MSRVGIHPGSVRPAGASGMNSVLRPRVTSLRMLIVLLFALALGMGGPLALASDKGQKKPPLPKAPKNLQISAPSKPRLGRTGASPERRAALRDAGNRLAEARRAVRHYQGVVAALPADQIAKVPDSARRAALFAERRAALVKLKRWGSQLQRLDQRFGVAAQDYVFSHNKWGPNNPRPAAPGPVRATAAPRGVNPPNPAAFPAAAVAARAAQAAAAGPPPVPARRQAQALNSAAPRPRPINDTVPGEPVAPAVPAAPATPPVPPPLPGSAADPPPPFDPRFAPPSQAADAAADPPPPFDPRFAPPESGADLGAQAARQGAIRAAQRQDGAPAVPPRRLPAAGNNPGQRVVYSQLPAAAVQAPGGGLQQRDARDRPTGLLRGVQNALAASEQVLVNPR